MIYRGYQCKSGRTALETPVALILNSLFVIQRSPKNARTSRWDEKDQRSKEDKRKEEERVEIGMRRRKKARKGSGRGTWLIYENLAVENFRWAAKKNRPVRLLGLGRARGESASNAAIFGYFQLRIASPRGYLFPHSHFSPAFIGPPCPFLRPLGIIGS